MSCVLVCFLAVACTFHTEQTVYARHSNINKVDATMESIREQMDLSNEISDAISNPVNMGIEVDDVSDLLFFPSIDSVRG